MGTPQADKFNQGTIVWRTDNPGDHWRMRVDPEKPFTFRPGQYATLGIQTSGRLVERAYSIVSSPYDAQLEFFIELVSCGELTPMLHRLRVGDTVSLRARAKGRFLFDETSGRTNHLLLCTSTGIAPYVSYVRTLLACWKGGRSAGDHHLFLLQGASRSSELGYFDEMTCVAREVPWLTYVPTVSRPADDPAWTGQTGRVDGILETYLDQWSLHAGRTTVYLCGHPGMIERGREIVLRRGWRVETLREEMYRLPTSRRS